MFGNDCDSASGFFRALRVLVCFTLVCLAGCGSGDRTREEIIDQTYQIEPTATLNISNKDGSIRIYGGGSPVLKLEAIKKAYSDERLSKISVNVSATQNAVSIETKFPPKRARWFADRSGTVDYIIVVPDTVRIPHVELENGELLIDTMRAPVGRAKLGSGRLFAHNCFTDVNIFVASGNFAVTYDWWEQRQFSVDAAIQDGNGFAFIPSEASFHLIAKTQNGKIGNDFTEQENRNGETVTNIDTVVGEGSQVTINLRATDGNIKIVEANP